ncbi:MAG: BamA/TamA family outer membrane protein [Cyclobacteriaceae bacterium]|nr:BamA/TamA family outer membrane protein [Cyclobacteriaceae bacterium]
MNRALLVLFFLLTCALTVDAQFRNRNRQSTSAPDESIVNYANPAEYIIAGIDVKGLNVLDKNAIISLTGLRIGDRVKVPGESIAGAIRKLWKHGLVGDVSISVDRIEGKNVYLIINLAERPRLGEYYFTGIPNSKQSTLKDELKLIKGKIVNDAMIRNTEMAVKKHFTKKGFLNVEVKITQEVDTVSRGQIRLRINIVPNARVTIANIHINGNKQMEAVKLRKQLKKTHEYARLTVHRTILRSLFSVRPHHVKEFLDSSKATSWKDVKKFLNDNIKLNFVAGSKFNRAEYEEDKKKMMDFYNAQGFRDAEITSDSIARHDDTSIDVFLNVNEGNKYYFRNIIWTGNYIHTNATLNKILDINKGDVYNKELLDKKTSFNPKGTDISGLYMDDGYLFFHVEPVEVAVVGDSIDIEMRVQEGDQATIDRVIISGNERTSDHVIRRELSTVPGQKFRRSDLIRTQQQLGTMGYFNAQKIGQEVRPNPTTGKVDIEWKVEEQSNDQVQLSGGWGGYYGFVGTVGLQFNNFSLRNIPHPERWRPLPVGDGQRFTINAQANGKNFQSYSTSFTEPWLGGKKPNSLTVSLNHSITRQSIYFSADATNAPMMKQSGVNVGLGRRLEWPDNYFTLTNSLAFLEYNYKNYFSSAALPKVGRTYSFTFNTVLSRNSIDNPMFPTQGSTLSLALNLTPPYSLFRDHGYLADINERYKLIELHKWMFDSKFYIKLIGSKKPDGRSLVIEAKAHMGFIGSYSRDVTPGPFERFLLGGDGLAGGFNSFVLGQEIIGLRGYGNNLITPPYYAARNNPSSASPLDQQKIEGGLVYDKLGLELRYPLVTGQSATIYGFLFTEAGNNWDNLQKFNPFDMYKSAGMGARIFMPAFGLIGLNWGYGFDTLPYANSRSGPQFHFMIGQQIR